MLIFKCLNIAEKYPALPGGKFTAGGREAEAAVEEADMEAMVAELSEEDQAAFRDFQARDAANTERAETSWGRRSFAHRITHPDSTNPTYMFATKTDYNDSQLAEWEDVVAPRLRATRERWAELDIASASDEALLEAMRDMCMEEGYYWSCNSSRTFGVGKSTDDHLQVFLSETLPDHNFISGQFLSGITDPDGNESKTMTANRDLFEIAKLVRLDEELTYTVIVTPSRFLMAALRANPDAGAVVAAIDQYLRTYGHQGYSMVRPNTFFFSSILPCGN